MIQLYGGHWSGEVVGGKTLTTCAGRNRWGHHLWYWRCPECQGPAGPSTLSHLKRSVRCFNCAMRPENNARWVGYEQLTGVWLSQYRLDAAKRGLDWKVTPEQLWEQWLLQAGRCAYTGWQLTHGDTASLDRIDNSHGYLPTNVQWVHRDINRMKSDFTEQGFLQVCAAVANHLAVARGV